MTARMILAAAAVVAAAVTTSALATGALKDPKTLVLQKSDLPAGARVLRRSGPTPFASGTGYGVTYRYRTASGSNELTSVASVMKNRSLAVKGFRELKSDYTKDVEFRLPKYGDEQHASFLLGTAQLIVRTDTVVWTLILMRTGSTGSNPNELTKAEAVAELKKYGAKQMRRVGSG
jgi:hypothetical protein